MSTYPQPDSNAPALASQDFFRIKQTMFDAGAIFESNQSSHAIAIGPDSDISRVTVDYPDPTSPTFMSSVVVSSQRTFDGTVYASPSELYAGSNRPRRIMMYSTDLLQDSLWVPSGYNPDTDDLLSVLPMLDIIQFFQPTAQAPARSDKVFDLEYYAWQPAGGGSLYITLPFYGRQYASVLFTSKEVADVTFGINGICFTQSPTVSQQVVLVAPETVASNATVNHVIKASASGNFDALQFKFTVANAGITKNIFRVVTSDEAL